MPRIVAFVNGALGARAIDLVRDQLVGAVLHVPERRRDVALLEGALPKGVPVFAPSSDLAQQVRALAPSHGLSVLYGHILRDDVIGCFPNGIANLHPSLLPHGRGAHPNAWALAKREPSGVTLHLMDAGVDTGPILAQATVPAQPTDTAKTLYERLMQAAERLLSAEVPRWLRGEVKPRPQSGSGSAHRVADLDSLKIEADRTYTGRELIDLLRARTFAPYPGAAYDCDGRKLRVRIEISEDPR
jgi:methionyl-tRNA formyltransferase